MFYDEELDQSEKFYDSQPLVLQLGYALYNMLVAHSEMVCYLVIILNHIMSANFATLVIPINIFLWAMLSVPRPSKRFWMTAIVYTEVGLGGVKANVDVYVCVDMYSQKFGHTVSFQFNEKVCPNFLLVLYVLYIGV